MIREKEGGRDVVGGGKYPHPLFKRRLQSLSKPEDSKLSYVSYLHLIGVLKRVGEVLFWVKPESRMGSF